MGISPNLCVVKEDKKEIKPLGPLWGPLIESFGVLPYIGSCRVRRDPTLSHFKQLL